MKVRLLPFECANGPANMAADETLLESAVTGVASLRFYAWAVPTLSLGYFQPEQDRLKNERLAGLPFVRRPSGGATLVHHFELTYALALPTELVRQSRASWLCRMHRIVTAALNHLGVPARMCGEEPAPVFEAGILCFHRWTPGDITLEGNKIVGSAQRKHRGALMQHGGILLAQSPFTPELPGLRELSGRYFSGATLAELITQELVGSCGWNMEPAEWTMREQHRKKELEEKKYAQDWWNGKR